MATFYFNVHTPESKRIADSYFIQGNWYYSIKSNIIAKYETTESNIGFWLFGKSTKLATFDKVRMLDIHEWLPCTADQVKLAEQFESAYDGNNPNIKLN